MTRNDQGEPARESPLWGSPLMHNARKRLRLALQVHVHWRRLGMYRKGVAWRRSVSRSSVAN